MLRLSDFVICRKRYYNQSDFEICCKMLKKDIIIRVRDLCLGLNTVGRGNLEHFFI